MTMSKRVYNAIMGDGPLEAGVYFVLAALGWPIALLCVLVGFALWGVGKGLGRLFGRKEGR